MRPRLRHTPPTYYTPSRATYTAYLISKVEGEGTTEPGSAPALHEEQVLHHEPQALVKTAKEGSEVRAERNDRGQQEHLERMA